MKISTSSTLIAILMFFSLIMETASLRGETEETSEKVATTPTPKPGFGSDGGPESSEGDPDHGAFGMPAVLSEEEPSTDPALFDQESAELLPERYLLRSTPWRAPDYSAQIDALGWDKDVFKVSAGLATRVAFWKEIYGKYTTDQGVMHDIDDITVIYEAIDFTLLMKDARMSLSKKARSRTKLVKTRRDEISKRLERLSRMKKEQDLKDPSDRRILALFTKGLLSNLFQKSRSHDLDSLKKRLKTSARKKRIRFQLGQKDKFVLGVYYSGRYLRSMEKVFRQEKLPIELTRLPFVESSFNIRARSRVGASGIWQFMPRTAKPWMMVNRDVDERNDPMTATAAAARLMRSNFERLRSWPLALTAYNHGATGVARAVRKTGSKELSVIIDNYEGRRFGFASSNFYACFLAALETERNARKVLGEIKWSLEFDGSEIDLPKALEWRSLIDFYDGESALAELQNPHLTKRVRSKNRSIPKGTFVRIPSSRMTLAKEFVSGKIDEIELKKRLTITPIPRTISTDVAGSTIKAKLGAVSEAAKSLLPFMSTSPTPLPGASK